MENCLRQHLHQTLSEFETIGGTGETPIERHLDVIMSMVGGKGHTTITATNITHLTTDEALAAANNLVAATV